MKNLIALILIAVFFVQCTKEGVKTNDEFNKVELESRSSNFTSEIENLSVEQIFDYLAAENNQSELVFDEILNFNAYYKEYNGETFIQIKGQAVANNSTLTFSAFPVFVNNGSELNISDGCKMICSANDCNTCKQTINEPCVSQTCNCQSGRGSCNPSTEF